MSLADKIYEANETPELDERDLGYDDEFGLRVWQTTDYIVARALAIAVRDRQGRYSIHQLHLRGDTIYNGNQIVEETTENIYRLSEYDRFIPRGQRTVFWRKLKQHLPVLDPNVIQISDDLFWDKDEGMVKKESEIGEKYLSS